MGNLGDFLLRIGKFFDGLQGSVQSGAFATTSTALVWVIWATCLVVLFFQLLLKWAEEKNSEMIGLVAFIMKHWIRGAVIGFFMVSSPVICTSVSGSVGSTLSGLNATVGAASASVMNSLQTTIQFLWNAQGPVKSRLKDLSPGLFDDMDGSDGLADTMAADATLKRMRSTAMAQIDAQLAEAKTLLASSNAKSRAQGALLQSQAKEAKRAIEQATSMSEIEVAYAKDKAGENDGAMARAFKAALRPATAVLTSGFSEFLKGFLTLKSYITSAVALIGFLGIPLLLAVMAGFKILEATVSVFSELARICIFTSLGLALAATMGPLAMATFFSEKWNSYGHRFVSYILQVMAGTALLTTTVKIAAIGIGRLGLMITTSGTTIFSTILAAQTMKEMFIAGLLGAIPLFVLGLAMSFFSSLISKAPSIGTGIVSGTWQP